MAGLDAIAVGECGVCGDANLGEELAYVARPRAELALLDERHVHRRSRRHPGKLDRDERRDLLDLLGTIAQRRQCHGRTPDAAVEILAARAGGNQRAQIRVCGKIII